jgi:type II secretory pathway pseudopilin PulG
MYECDKITMTVPAISLRSPRRPRGMTLVELLMSFAILMAGLVCVFALLLAGTSAHRRAIKETEATMIAGSVLADLRSDFARGLVPKGNGANDFVELEDHPGFKSNSVIFSVDPKRTDEVKTNVNDREFFVRVRVRWSEKGDNQYVEFNTVMFKGTPVNGIERAIKQ